MDLKKTIRHVQDFPVKGIGFKDITTLLMDGPALAEAVRQMAQLYDRDRIDLVLGIESRGFIFAGILAHLWGVGMVPVRKPDKLPHHTIRETYELEYGQDALEIHRDAVRKGQRVLIVDDLLATGGTASATVRLVRRLGGEVAGCCFLIELAFLNGRQRLSGTRVESLIHFDSE